jgi:hypothetical protein
MCITSLVAFCDALVVVNRNAIRGHAIPHPLLAEELLSLSAAARLVPPYRGSRGTSPATLFRWCRDGVKLPAGGVLKLESVRLVSRVLTSREALVRFLDRQHAARAGTDAPLPRTPRRRRRAGEAAGKELERLGC